MAADDRDDDDELDVEEAEEEPEEAADAEDDEEEEEAKPKPKVTVLTLVLILLNLVMAPTFLVLLTLDYFAHQQWSSYTFLNHLYVWGLPLQEEEDGPTFSRETRPAMRYEGGELKKAFN